MTNQPEWWDKEEYVKDGTMGDPSDWDIPAIIAEAEKRKEIEVLREMKLKLFEAWCFSKSGFSNLEHEIQGMKKHLDSRLAALEGKEYGTKE